MSNNSYC